MPNENYKSVRAKVITTDGSQIILLPQSYRLDCDELYIRTAPDTGDVILSKRLGSWDECFQLMDEYPVTEDFVIDRQNTKLPNSGRV